MAPAPQLDDVEKQPLLPAAPTELPAPEKQARTWRGHWSQLFGPSFEAHDTAACCLAWHAPPVAFGWNSQRALGLSWWKEAGKFALLTIGLLMLGRFVCMTAMMVACPPPPPPEMGPGAVMMVGGPMNGGVMPAHAAAAASWGDAKPAVFKVDEDDDDDDHFFKHAGHWRGDRPPVDPLSPEMQQCFAAVFPAAVTCALISTLGIAAVIIMASRRRIAIRERYGIDGTPMGDLCLWAWCAPCALAQETRTLMHNNVAGEMWHGPHVAPAPITA